MRSANEGTRWNCLARSFWYVSASRVSSSACVRKDSGFDRTLFFAVMTRKYLVRQPFCRGAVGINCGRCDKASGWVGVTALFSWERSTKKCGADPFQGFIGASAIEVKHWSEKKVREPFSQGSSSFMGWISLYFRIHFCGTLWKSKVEMKEQFFILILITLF